MARNQHTSPVFSKPIRNQIYDLSLLTPKGWKDQRPCWYCGVQFKPKAPGAYMAHFCCEDHRKAFNKYGFMPYEKLLIALVNRIDQHFAQLKQDIRLGRIRFDAKLAKAMRQQAKPKEEVNDVQDEAFLVQER